MTLISTCAGCCDGQTFSNFSYKASELKKQGFKPVALRDMICTSCADTLLNAVYTTEGKGKGKKTIVWIDCIATGGRIKIDLGCLSLEVARAHGGRHPARVVPTRHRVHPRSGAERAREVMRSIDDYNEKNRDRFHNQNKKGRTCCNGECPTQVPEVDTYCE